ncbi:hypothetical protein [uncultured Maribacter sp.]|mgnify:CR=1 FL=1|uniref:hypothetical protein n=1 Tax=uncultured Maribacter sp. TaxID=431308 RepID=UPI0030ED67FC|tara:strand:+ start:51164 stop:52273 length:1110 start_codon:yes stop_codon:yes gene_type:complete
MNSKKIVLISQTFYPRQSPRALRTTELAKQLALYGHEVIIYSVLGSYDYTSFEKEFNLNVKSIENLRFATFNSDGKRRNDLPTRILSKFFGKILEFPDVELMFKIPSIIKKETKVDLLITVAIPYPLHWGAALAKVRKPAQFPKVWVADCGDPYMGNEFHKPNFYFKYVEKWFCRKVDFITIPVKGAISAYYPEFYSKIKIIPQGFNFEKTRALLKKGNAENKIITFAYAGAFYPGIRDPRLFLEYLSKLETNFKFILYTKNTELLAPFKEKLKGKMEIRDYISREELLQVLSQMDFVVNFENGTAIQTPSKLIDYALIGKPILSIDSFNLDRIKVNEFLKNDYSRGLIIENIEQYDIRNVSKQFLKLS